MNPPEHGQDRNAVESVVIRVLIILGTALFIYLLGFAALVLFPQVSRNLNAMGISGDQIDWIYSPVVRLLE